MDETENEHKERDTERNNKKEREKKRGALTR